MSIGLPQTLRFHCRSPVCCGSSLPPLQSAGYIPLATHRRNDECGQSAGCHETMLDRVEMRIVHVSRKVAIVPRIVCSQYRRCQMPRSPRRVMTGDRGSPIGSDFANPVLITRHRPGKSASSCGNVHRQCMWSVRTTQAAM